MKINTITNRSKNTDLIKYCLFFFRYRSWELRYLTTSRLFFFFFNSILNCLHCQQAYGILKISGWEGGRGKKGKISTSICENRFTLVSEYLIVLLWLHWATECLWYQLYHLSSNICNKEIKNWITFLYLYKRSYKTFNKS